MGQNIVLFIGAIASVDPVLYEAANLDGANAWQRFKSIIIPSIRTIAVLNLILSVSGALTYACPVVAEIIPFGERNEADMLRLAACLEEHFPHSMTNAVVQAARERGLDHEKIHFQAEYIVAHGIVSEVSGRRVIIGSVLFVFEDEHCAILEGEQQRYDSLPEQYSHLYLAVGGVLSAVVCISAPCGQRRKP